MPELEDLSGPFNPDLRFDDFSKSFLLKLMNVWQWAWLHQARAWYETIQKRFGSEAANDCEREAWVTMGERVNPRYAKIANIELNTVLDSLKAAQLPPDNISTSGLFPPRFEIKNPNHVIMTVTDCRPLSVLERDAPERIRPVCYVLEELIMAKYFMNPNIKATPLKLPPLPPKRRSPGDIACQWELKLEA